jgi:hypothetical protein
MADSIENQFEKWAAERKAERELNYLAAAGDMERIEKPVSVGLSKPQTQAFFGKLLASREDPATANGTQVIREVYLTRRRQFAIWWQTQTGQHALERREDLEALNQTLAEFHWGDLADEVARALEKEINELDW